MLKFLLLGLLSRTPRYGYELRQIFEELFGGLWPLNPGQIYSALGRLEDDGLIQAEVVPQDLLPDRKVYSLTEEGRYQLKIWTQEPVDGPVKLRDELVMKIVTRGLLGGEGVTDLVWAQREAHMKTLAKLSQLRADATMSPATALLLDAAILRAEADLKWLDLCEEQLPEVGK